MARAHGDDEGYVGDEFPTHESDHRSRHHKRRKARLAQNWSWAIAGIVMIVVLQTQWKPQSDWTVAIKWIVLMSPIYYVASSLIELVKMAIVGLDDDY